MVAIVAASALLVQWGCGNDTGAAAKRPPGPPAVQVTATVVQPRNIELTESVVGSLENVMDPSLGAEVAGRVTRVLGFVGKKVVKGELLAEIDPQDFEIQSRIDGAEIGRVASLLDQQERVLERQQKLVAQGFISQNAVDDAAAQRNALREQSVAANARAEQTHRSIGKSRVHAPIDGEIETQIVAVGDYVKLGDPLFKLVGTQRLHAHLPLPESAAGRIRTGLKVRISAPSAPQVTIEAKIDEIRPTLIAASRAMDAIARFDNNGSFRGGGSVNARIVIAVREGALTVPETSVVLRPAGTVAYVLTERDGRLIAQQRQIETGIRQDGYYEVLNGLRAGDRVAVDGAGFLTDNAPVTLPTPKAPAGEGPKGKPAAPKS